MFQKTDSTEFSSGFLWQVCLLAVVALMYVLFSYKLVPRQPGEIVSYPQPILYPWMFPAGHTIENALLDFGGKPPQVARIRDQANALGTVLISMVLCPTIFLLEWRRRKLAGQTQNGTPPLKISSVLYAFTGAITIYFGAGVLPVTYFSESVHKSTQEAQGVQSDRDLIINELNFLDYRLEEYFILPRHLGGGDGSFEGFVAPPEVTKTNVASYEVTAKRDLVEIRATSLRYPSAWIKVQIDTACHMCGWQYGGEFM